MNDSPPDWQSKAAAEARDEQRRQPRWYPSTKQELAETEYTPEHNHATHDHIRCRDDGFNGG